MSAKSRKNRKARRQNTPLSGHRQQGKVLVPPLKRIPNLHSIRWLPDLFPNFLWLSSLIAIDDLKGMGVSCGALDAIDEVLDREDGSAHKVRPDKLVIDGSLSSLERIPREARGFVLEYLDKKALYETSVPEEFAHALGMYPEAPGSWLIDLWRQRGLSVDWEKAQRFLADVISKVSHGQARATTRVKFIVLRSWFKAGRVFISKDMKDDAVRLFPKYPEQITEEERRIVEPTIRAMFGAFTGVGELIEPATDWSKEFWRSNWKKFPCWDKGSNGSIAGDHEQLKAAVKSIDAEVQELHQNFLDTATKADPDLYAPEKYEVLTGISSRAIRVVAAAGRMPLLWSQEHGSFVLRSVVEALIVLRWLIKKDDAVLYERFKAYGRGRMKLLKLHVEEYLDSLQDPPEELRRYAEHLDGLVNEDLMEEWQEISLEGNFAGTDTRRMAADVQMERVYKLVFAPASSTAHGEWTSIDRYALERCRNPLHRWHRVPRVDFSTPIGPDLITAALGFLEELIEAYKCAVDPQKVSMTTPRRARFAGCESAPIR